MSEPPPFGEKLMEVYAIENGFLLVIRSAAHRGDRTIYAPSEVEIGKAVIAEQVRQKLKRDSSSAQLELPLGDTTKAEVAQWGEDYKQQYKNATNEAINEALKKDIDAIALGQEITPNAAPNRRKTNGE
jgi:hypothetical protein